VTASRIVVLGTGGTIAGTSAVAGDNIGYTAAQVGVAQLLAAVPGLAGRDLVSEQVAQLDSKDMDEATWRQLAARCAFWLAQDEVQAIVITHGTDTLEETAWFLQCVVAPSKPIVLTCAMRPSTSLAPDGPQNLLDAVTVAQAAGARGVVAVCAGRIHGAQDVQKVHPYRLDAFDSGDAGVIGYVEEGHVRQLRPWPLAPGVSALDVLERAWPRVEIVLSHAGASGATVDALVASGVSGLVVAATGNGTIHRSLEAALLRAQVAGVRVVRSTRCPSGRVLAQAEPAFVDSAGLSPVKARIAMMLGLLG
jgi:L-asparaginase